MNGISVKGVTKKYGHQTVLKSLDLEVAPKSQIVIQGASGSGKSTFLYLLGGLERADSGTLNVFGENLQKKSDTQLASFRNHKVGFVFQFHFLLPSMTCLDNIFLPARLGGKNIEQIKPHVLNLANTLGIKHCFAKYPYQLSGGEQQRVNILRALSLRPALLLCDEPTGNLDSQNSQIVVELLRSLASECESTLLLVTHDNEMARQFDRRIHLKDGQVVSLN